MKKIMNGRKLAAVLSALILMFTGAFAGAESGADLPAAKSETVASLLQVLDFKFFVREEGIGKGTCPVYTAPSEESLRLADGMAKCSVEGEISVAGYVDGWLMVRYEIKDKKVRVGYIPPRYARGCVAKVSKIEFGAIPVQLDEEITITDNPRSNSTPFGTLPRGAEITILGKYTYTGNWWYVETRLDGTLTRGFVNRSEAAILVDGEVYHGNGELGTPVVSPLDTEQTGTITVKGSEDDAMIVRREPGTDNAMVARVYGGESFPCYGAQTLANGRIWFYIWVDGVWGWFAGGNSTFTGNE